jgi:hypothetical protein
VAEGEEGKRRSRKRQPKWPTLDEQFARARVIHGSRLEQLIRDNQDFEVLHEDEVNDGLDYPPWLRIHWRKAHPEMEYLPESASKGYPLVLERIYEWMIEHQDLAPDSDSETEESR